MSAYSQNDKSLGKAERQLANSVLSDSIRKYFNYDTLKNFNCSKFPPGIYALKFKVRNGSTPYDYEFSDDSIGLLKQLFISALEFSLKQTKYCISNKPYLQFFYFNNYFHCLYTQENSQSNDIYKDVSDMLGYQIELIEKTFQRAINSNNKEYIVLNPVIINNQNPNDVIIHSGFKGDTKKNRGEKPPDSVLLRIMEEKKKKEDKKAN
jgi:hypothetical protein